MMNIPQQSLPPMHSGEMPGKPFINWSRIAPYAGGLVLLSIPAAFYLYAMSDLVVLGGLFFGALIGTPVFHQKGVSMKGVTVLILNVDKHGFKPITRDEIVRLVMDFFPDNEAATMNTNDAGNTPREGGKLGILVRNERYLDQLVNLVHAAHDKGLHSQIFFTGKGVLLTQKPDFAKLVGKAARISVCDVSRGANPVRGFGKGFGGCQITRTTPCRVEA